MSLTKTVSMSPCPFCGGPPVVITVDACKGGTIDDPDPDHGTLAHAYVFCHECGAQGPHSEEGHVYVGGGDEKLEADAVCLWNDRDARHLALYEASVLAGRNTFPRRADEPSCSALEREFDPDKPEVHITNDALCRLGEHDGLPTDGQLLDQLEAATERLEAGYCEQDIELRKALALSLVRFNRAAVNRSEKP